MYSRDLTAKKSLQTDNETGSLLSAHEHFGFGQESDKSLDIHIPSHNRSWWKEHVIRGAIAIFSVTVGVFVGFWLTTSPNFKEPTSIDFGINRKTPLPQEIFTDRRDVPFIPHKEFIGPSEEADENWNRITMGTVTRL